MDITAIFRIQMGLTDLNYYSIGGLFFHSQLKLFAPAVKPGVQKTKNPQERRLGIPAELIISQ